MALAPSLGRLRTKLKLGAGFAVGFNAAGQAAVAAVGAAIFAAAGSAAGVAATDVVGRGVTAMAGTSTGATATVAAVAENVAAATPAIADQEFEVGALTLAGYGGFIPVNTGTAWSSINFTSSPNGNPSGHWQINTSTGEISPSTAGDAANLSLGTYVLNVTATNANGSDTANITVYTQRTDANGFVLANSRSVANMTQFRAELQSANLAYGTNILLRTGAYNYAQADQRAYRSATTAGTWNGYGEADQAWMNDNWIVVRPHAGNSPVIHHMSLYADGGSSSWRMKFQDLAFQNSAQSGVTGLVVGTTQNTSKWLQELWFDQCSFDGVNQTKTGINLNAGARNTAANGGKLRVTDCTFVDCVNNMTIWGPDRYVVGNSGTSQSGDFIFNGPPITRGVVRWNRLSGYTEEFTELTILSYSWQTTPSVALFTTVSLADAALVNNGYNWVLSLPGTSLDGTFKATTPTTVTVNQATGVITWSGVNGSSLPAYTGGGKIYAYLSHGDFCQIQNQGAGIVDGDFDDFTFSENIIILNPTSNQYTQGVAGLITRLSGSLYMRRARIRGNLYVGKQTNAIVMGQAVDSDISWNTVIDYPDYTTQIQPQNTPKIEATTGSGNVVKYNIVHSIDAATATQTGNQTLTRGDTATYAAQFNNPVGLLSPTLDPANDYSLNPSGSWYALSPRPGATAYVDYEARTTSYPDETSSANGVGSATAFAVTSAVGLGLQTAGAGSAAGVATVAAVGTFTGTEAYQTNGMGSFDDSFIGNTYG